MIEAKNLETEDEERNGLIVTEQENNSGMSETDKILGKCIASTRSSYTAGKACISVQCVSDGSNYDGLLDDSGMVVRAV